MLRALAVAFALGIFATAPAAAQGAFYHATEAEIAGEPGTIIRQQVMPGAPQDTIGYRVLYRSTGLSGEPIAVSGVVLIPTTGTPVVGNAPRIIAWAHPTTGVGDACAPSLAPLQFALMPGIPTMIRDGFIVAITDYPGLGTAGVHPFLVGDSEGRAVIDSVRAARIVAAAIVGPVDNRFAVWGHSQGGHAALFTGQLAASYAPELTLVGIAAAAPPTDLLTLTREDANTTAGNNLTAVTLWSWAQLFGPPLDTIVEPSAIPNLNLLAEKCIDRISGLLSRRPYARILQEGFLSVDDLTAVAPWNRYMADNSPGLTPASVPVYIAQGDADVVVPAPVTLDYMARLCRAGREVTLNLMAGVGHGPIANDTAAATVAWIVDRFNGAPVPNSCRG